MTKKIKKAIFPVGGLGTRFLPATKSMPKEMLPIANKPLIQYAFEEAQKAGIETCIFITGRNKNAISNHFDHSFELEKTLLDNDKLSYLKATRDWVPEAGTVAFIRQKQPLGLGHAIWCARNFIDDNEPVAILLADELFLSEEGMLAKMVQAYEQSESNMIALTEVEHNLTDRYGIADISHTKGNVARINDMIEKPAIEDAPSNFAMTGRYILQHEIFEYLGRQETGKNGEIQLTDAMSAMLNDGKEFNGVISDSPRFDCGSQVGFLEANVAFSLANHPDKVRIKNMLKKYI